MRKKEKGGEKGGVKKERGDRKRQKCGRVAEYTKDRAGEG